MDGVIRVFPRRTSYTPTDSLAFVGLPTLFRPQADLPVKVSTTFTWDREYAQKFAYAWGAFYSDVQVGGPAFGDFAGEFTPGLFTKPGVIFTSRGCPRECRFCLVPRREGRLRELPIQPGYIIQDNNLLACSRQHIEGVFEMLRQQKRGAIFSGGLDASLFRSWHRELLDSIRINELWFACDSLDAFPVLRCANEHLDGISIEKKRCYVLIGFNGETIFDAEDRLEAIYALGFLPFAQLWRSAEDQGPATEEVWRRLVRKWSRPAAYRNRSLEAPLSTAAEARRDRACRPLNREEIECLF